MKQSERICPTCGGSHVVVRDTRLNKDGTRWWRFKCQACQDDWRVQDGQVLEDYTPKDRRVEASELCKYCIHECKGFCSLGFPEANDPTFVPFCVARTLRESVPVLH
jgi:hypothetical protein